MNAPDCRRCDEPCRWVYSIVASEVTLAPFEYLQEAGRNLNPRIVWLCAACVDEIAEVN